MNNDMLYSEEAERVVLASIIADISCIEIVKETLIAEDFYFRNNREIYKVMLYFDELESTATIENICEMCAYRKVEKDYILMIIKTEARSLNVKAYANIVREKSIMRSLMNSSNAKFSLIDVVNIVKAFNEDPGVESSEIIQEQDEAYKDLRIIAEEIFDDINHMLELSELLSEKYSYLGLDEAAYNFSTAIERFLSIDDERYCSDAGEDD